MIKINATVEPVLKDNPIGHKSVVSQDRWPFGEMWDLLSGISGLSRQVISHGSGLS